MRISRKTICLKQRKSKARGTLAADKSVEWANPEVIPAKQRRLALLYISMTVLLWGVPFISTKMVLTDIPPVSIAFFKQIIVLMAWH
jgi:hypothetical protein